MSIIFDALKRAEAQAQKGQAPTLARVRLSQTPSKVRLWALAGVFVVLGIGAWWFSGIFTKPTGILASAQAVKPDAQAVKPDATAVKPNATQREVGINGALTPDLSLEKADAIAPTPVVATDLNANAAEFKPSGGPSLSVPNLDIPLTGAAQFNKKPEPVVAVAPPVSPPVPVRPVKPPAQPATPPLSEPKPVAEVAPPAMTPPVVTPPPVAPEPSLPSVFELDYKVRHDLPKMVVSMYVYNAQQQFRFVIIGGKRYAEGEQIESKVSITKIRADGLECEFQGSRFFYPRQSL